MMQNQIIQPKLVAHWLNKQGVQCYKRNDFEQALSKFYVASLYSNSSRYFFNISKCYRKLNRTNQRLIFRIKAKSANPNYQTEKDEPSEDQETSTSTHQNIVEKYYEQASMMANEFIKKKDYISAANKYNEKGYLKGESKSYQLAATYFTKLEDYTSALLSLTQAIRINPNATAAISEKKKIQELEKNSYQKSKIGALIQTLLAKQAKFSDITKRGIRQFQQNQYAASIKIFDQLIVMQNLPIFHQNKQCCYLAMNDYENAVKCSEVALGLNLTILNRGLELPNDDKTKNGYILLRQGLRFYYSGLESQQNQSESTAIHFYSSAIKKYILVDIRFMDILVPLYINIVYKLLQINAFKNIYQLVDRCKKIFQNTHISERFNKLLQTIKKEEFDRPQEFILKPREHSKNPLKLYGARQYQFCSLINIQMKKTRTLKTFQGNLSLNELIEQLITLLREKQTLSGQVRNLSKKMLLLITQPAIIYLIDILKKPGTTKYKRNVSIFINEIKQHLLFSTELVLQTFLEYIQQNLKLTSDEFLQTQNELFTFITVVQILVINKFTCPYQKQINRCFTKRLHNQNFSVKLRLDMTRLNRALEAIISPVIENINSNSPKKQMQLPFAEFIHHVQRQKPKIFQTIIEEKLIKLSESQYIILTVQSFSKGSEDVKNNVLIFLKKFKFQKIFPTYKMLFSLKQFVTLVIAQKNHPFLLIDFNFTNILTAIQLLIQYNMIQINQHNEILKTLESQIINDKLTTQTKERLGKIIVSLKIQSYDMNKVIGDQNSLKSIKEFKVAFQAAKTYKTDQFQYYIRDVFCKVTPNDFSMITSALTNKQFHSKIKNNLNLMLQQFRLSGVQFPKTTLNELKLYSDSVIRLPEDRMLVSDKQVKYFLYVINILIENNIISTKDKSNEEYLLAFAKKITSKSLFQQTKVKIIHILITLKNNNISLPKEAKNIVNKHFQHIFNKLHEQIRALLDLNTKRHHQLQALLTEVIISWEKIIPQSITIQMLYAFLKEASDHFFQHSGKIFCIINTISKKIEGCQSLSKKLKEFDPAVLQKVVKIIQTDQEINLIVSCIKIVTFINRKLQNIEISSIDSFLPKMDSKKYVKQILNYANRIISQQSVQMANTENCINYLEDIITGDFQQYDSKESWRILQKFPEKKLSADNKALIKIELQIGKGAIPWNDIKNRVNSNKRQSLLCLSTILNNFQAQLCKTLIETILNNHQLIKKSIISNFIGLFNKASEPVKILEMEHKSSIIVNLLKFNMIEPDQIVNLQTLIEKISPVARQNIGKSLKKDIKSNYNNKIIKKINNFTDGKQLQTKPIINLSSGIKKKLTKEELKFYIHSACFTTEQKIRKLFVGVILSEENRNQVQQLVKIDQLKKLQFLTKLQIKFNIPYENLEFFMNVINEGFSVTTQNIKLLLKILIEKTTINKAYIWKILEQIDLRQGIPLQEIISTQLIQDTKCVQILINNMQKIQQDKLNSIIKIFQNKIKTTVTSRSLFFFTIVSNRKQYKVPMEILQIFGNILADPKKQISWRLASLDIIQKNKGRDLNKRIISLIEQLTLQTRKNDPKYHKLNQFGLLFLQKTHANSQKFSTQYYVKFHPLIKSVNPKIKMKMLTDYMEESSIRASTKFYLLSALNDHLCCFNTIDTSTFVKGKQSQWCFQLLKKIIISQCRKSHPKIQDFNLQVSLFYRISQQLGVKLATQKSKNQIESILRKMIQKQRLNGYTLGNCTDILSILLAMDTKYTDQYINQEKYFSIQLLVEKFITQRISNANKKELELLKTHVFAIRPYIIEKLAVKMKKQDQKNSDFVKEFIKFLEYLEEQNWNSDAVELFVEKDIREESKIKDWIEILSATISIKILSEKFPNYNKLVADDEMKSITIQNTCLFCIRLQGVIIQCDLKQYFKAQNLLTDKSLDMMLNDTKSGLKHAHILLQIFKLSISNGHHLAVFTTYPLIEVVEKILAKLGLTKEEMQKIEIIAYQPPKDKKGMNEHIENTKAKNKVSQKKNIYLIDSSENCQIAISAGYSGIKNNKVNYLGELKKLASQSNKLDRNIIKYQSNLYNQAQNKQYQYSKEDISVILQSMTKSKTYNVLIIDSNIQIHAQIFANFTKQNKKRLIILLNIAEDHWVTVMIVKISDKSYILLYKDPLGNNSFSKERDLFFQFVKNKLITVSFIVNKSQEQTDKSSSALFALLNLKYTQQLEDLQFQKNFENTKDFTTLDQANDHRLSKFPKLYAKIQSERQGIKQIIDHHRPQLRQLHQLLTTNIKCKVGVKGQESSDDNIVIDLSSIEGQNYFNQGFYKYNYTIRLLPGVKKQEYKSNLIKYLGISDKSDFLLIQDKNLKNIKKQNKIQYKSFQQILTQDSLRNICKRLQVRSSQSNLSKLKQDISYKTVVQQSKDKNDKKDLQTSIYLRGLHKKMGKVLASNRLQGKNHFPNELMRKTVNNLDSHQQIEQLSHSLSLISNFKLEHTDTMVGHHSLAKILQSKQKNMLESVHTLAIEKKFMGKSTRQSLQELKNELDNSNKENNIRYLKQVNLVNEYNKILQAGQKKSTQNISNKPINTWQKEQILKWAQKVKGQAFKEINFYQKLAVVRRGYCLFKQQKFEIRDINLYSVLILLNKEKDKGRLCQINTGQGKTSIVSFLTVLKALEGHKVDVITSSTELAGPQSQEQSPFFQMFELTCSHNGDKGKDSKLQTYSADIIYGAAGDFQGDILRSQYSKMNVRNNRPFDVAIVDEVDSMLLDGKNYMVMLSTKVPGMEHLISIISAIWLQLSTIAKGLIEDNGKLIYRQEKRNFDTNTNQQLTPEYSDTQFPPGSQKKQILQDLTEQHVRKLLRDTKNLKDKNIQQNYPTLDVPQHLRDFVCDIQLMKWINSAIYAMFSCELDKHYVLKDGKSIAPVDTFNTGVVQANMIWSNGLHQFLQLKHGTTITPESITTNLISNVAFFKRYGTNLFGLTGTLGSPKSRDILKETYSVDSVIIPPHMTKQYSQLEPIHCRNPSEWYRNIIESCLSVLKNGRAALIITKYIEEVEHLKQELEGTYNYDVNKIRIYETQANSKDIQGKQIYPGQIIIATNIVGRGTDIRPKEELELKGGLHVCVTFLPQNQRVEKQNVGRTSRSGKRGTAQFVILDQDWKELNQLRISRDKQQEESLKKAKNQMNKIQIKDCVFRQFCKLLSKFTDTVNNKQLDQKFMKSPMIRSVEQRFGLWLRQEENNIVCENSEEQKRIFLAKFEEFQQNILLDKSTNKLAKNPHYLLIEGNEIFQKQTVKSYDLYCRSIEMDKKYAANGYYSRACARIRIHGQSDNLAIRKKQCLQAIQDFKAAKKIIEQNYKTVINFIQKSSNGELLCDQLAIKLKVYDSQLAQITFAIGEGEGSINNSINQMRAQIKDGDQINKTYPYFNKLVNSLKGEIIYAENLQNKIKAEFDTIQIFLTKKEEIKKIIAQVAEELRAKSKEVVTFHGNKSLNEQIKLKSKKVLGNWTQQLQRIKIYKKSLEIEVGIMKKQLTQMNKQSDIYKHDIPQLSNNLSQSNRQLERVTNYIQREQNEQKSKEAKIINIDRQIEKLEDYMKKLRRQPRRIKIQLEQNIKSMGEMKEDEKYKKQFGRIRHILDKLQTKMTIQLKGLDLSSNDNGQIGIQLEQYASCGYLGSFDIEDVKPPFNYWNAIALMFIALAQIVAGAILIATGFGATLGAALIGEGVSDLITAVVDGFINQDFNWKSWGIQKAISLLVGVVSFGVGLIASKVGMMVGKEVVKVVGKNLVNTVVQKTILKTIGVALVKGVASRLASVLVDYAVNKLITPNIEEEISKSVNEALKNCLQKNDKIHQMLKLDAKNNNNLLQTIIKAKALQMLKQGQNMSKCQLLTFAQELGKKSIKGVKEATAVYEAFATVAQVNRMIPDFVAKLEEKINQLYVEQQVMKQLQQIQSQQQKQKQKVTQKSTEGKDKKGQQIKEAEIIINQDDIDLKKIQRQQKQAQANPKQQNAVAKTPDQIRKTLASQLSSKMSAKIVNKIIRPAANTGVSYCLSKAFNKLDEIQQKNMKQFQESKQVKGLNIGVKKAKSQEETNNKQPIAESQQGETIYTQNIASNISNKIGVIYQSGVAKMSQLSKTLMLDKVIGNDFVKKILVGGDLDNLKAYRKMTFDAIATGLPLLIPEKDREDYRQLIKMGVDMAQGFCHRDIKNMHFDKRKCLPIMNEAVRVTAKKLDLPLLEKINTMASGVMQLASKPQKLSMNNLVQLVRAGMGVIGQNAPIIDNVMKIASNIAELAQKRKTITKEDIVPLAKQGISILSRELQIPGLKSIANTALELALTNQKMQASAIIPKITEGIRIAADQLKMPLMMKAATVAEKLVDLGLNNNKITQNDMLNLVRDGLSMVTEGIKMPQLNPLIKKILQLKATNSNITINDLKPIFEETVNIISEQCNIEWLGKASKLATEAISFATSKKTLTQNDILICINPSLNLLQSEFNIPLMSECNSMVDKIMQKSKNHQSVKIDDCLPFIQSSLNLISDQANVPAIKEIFSVAKGMNSFISARKREKIDINSAKNMILSASGPLANALNIPELNRISKVGDQIQKLIENREDLDQKTIMNVLLSNMDPLSEAIKMPILKQIGSISSKIKGFVDSKKDLNEKDMISIISQVVNISPENARHIKLAQQMAVKLKTFTKSSKFSQEELTNFISENAGELSAQFKTPQLEKISRMAKGFKTFIAVNEGANKQILMGELSKNLNELSDVFHLPILKKIDAISADIKKYADLGTKINESELITYITESLGTLSEQKALPLIKKINKFNIDVAKSTLEKTLSKKDLQKIVSQNMNILTSELNNILPQSETGLSEFSNHLIDQYGECPPLKEVGVIFDEQQKIQIAFWTNPMVGIKRKTDRYEEK